MKSVMPHTVPKYVINGFFVIGLISAVAFRAIIIMQNVEPAWVRPTWYVAVLGYLVFFCYRYWISKKRKRAIEHFQLIEKVRQNACLTDQDREVVIYLLSSLKFSKEDLNYGIIFLLSVAAIAADLIMSGF